MPKESSKKEARMLAATKIMNLNVNYVEIDIQASAICVTVSNYDGTTEEFRWKD